jgi:hypothetical protein
MADNSSRTSSKALTKSELAIVTAVNAICQRGFGRVEVVIHDARFRWLMAKWFLADGQAEN